DVHVAADDHISGDRRLRVYEGRRMHHRAITVEFVDHGGARSHTFLKLCFADRDREYLRNVMAIILSDAGQHAHLLPLTFTRPVGQLRPGILRISEGWYVRSGLGIGYRTEEYLREAFPIAPHDGSQFEVDASLFPGDDLVAAVMDLQPGEVLVHEGRSLAFALQGEAAPSPMDWTVAPAYLKQIPFTGKVLRYDRPWHLFLHAGEAIRQDFNLLTEGRRSA